MARVSRRFEGVRSVLCERRNGGHMCNVDGSPVFVSSVEFSEPWRKVSGDSWIAVEYRSGYCFLEDGLLRCTPGRKPKFPVRPLRISPVHESIAPPSFRPERLNVRYAW